MSGPDERELESEQTDETRYDRLREAEEDERRAAVERLRDDPLPDAPDDAA